MKTSIILLSSSLLFFIHLSIHPSIMVKTRAQLVTCLVLCFLAFICCSFMGDPFISCVNARPNTKFHHQHPQSPRLNVFFDYLPPKTHPPDKNWRIRRELNNSWACNLLSPIYVYASLCKRGRCAIYSSCMFWILMSIYICCFKYKIHKKIKANTGSLERPIFHHCCITEGIESVGYFMSVTSLSDVLSINNSIFRGKYWRNYLWDVSWGKKFIAVGTIYRRTCRWNRVRQYI